jgi:uncharacterized protein (DUF779 family)
MTLNQWGSFNMVELKRVVATPITIAWLEKLAAMHGPLLFYQSGGCCEGSAPLCLPQTDYKIGSNDVFLGMIGSTPFYMSESQYDYWKHTQLIIDVIQGGGNAFSVESPEQISFHTRSYVFTDQERKELLKKLGPVLKGKQHT